MNIIATPFLSLILVLPFLYFGKKRSNESKEFIPTWVLYFLIDMTVTSLPIEFPSLDFVKLEMNWSGKIYSYILAITFLFFYNKLPINKFGFTFKQKKGSVPFAIWTTTTFALMMIAYSIFIGRYKADIENILFQLTMPSIIEEVVYRGILVSLFSLIYIDNLHIGNINFGIGAVVTSILFGLWHGLNINVDFDITMSWTAFIYTGLIGFILALVRERTGSLLFPIIIHVMVNTIPQTMGYFF